MEAIQSYYLYKESQKCVKNKIFEKVFLWAKESLSLSFSYEKIQHKILLHYFPQFLENSKNIKLFRKRGDIENYIQEIIENNNIQGIVVINISNKQILIVEKTLQDVYIIDPTSMLQIKNVHNIQWLEKYILPIFKKNQYHCEYVQLTYPAQNKYSDGSTWLMILLLRSLEQLYETRSIDVLWIPDKCQDKEKILNAFYKTILDNINLYNEVLEIFLEMIETKMNDIESIEELEYVLSVDPIKLLKNKL
jgi:hypothetical protein